MNYTVTIDGDSRSVRVEKHPVDGWTVSVDDGESQVWTGERLDGAEWILKADAQSQRLGAHVSQDEARLQISGHSLIARVLDSRSLAAAGGASEEEQGQITTAIPGAVVRVLVSNGDAVRQGQVLLVVEAMKMENEFKAPFDGVIEQLPVNAGDTVNSGQLLAVVGQA